jgi:hypothetical protein
MKKINRFFSLRNLIPVTIFLISFFLVNCKGSKGDPGNDGAPGNANVKSVQYTVQPYNWIGNLDGYSATLNVPEITQDIYTNGAVLVYIYNLQNLTFNMLPYTYVDNASTSNMDFDAYVGNIILYLKTTESGVNTTQAPTGTKIFKIIIVEGTPITALNKNVNVTNYNAVIKYFRVTENSKIVK